MNIVEALKVIQLAARIQGDAQNFRDLRPVYIEWLINQLEHHADRPVRQHARIDEVRRHVELIVRPNTTATTAASSAGRVIVHPFALVGVIVVDHVPVVDDQLRGAL